MVDVGLTFDLRSDYAQANTSAPSPLSRGLPLPSDYYGEFDSEETVRYLAEAIAQAGHTIHKIGHIKKLAAFLAGGQQVDLVFNIAEGLIGRSREAQVPSLLDAYAIPYTGSDALTLALTLNKALTKQLWRYHDLPTADFCVVECPEHLSVLRDELPDFPVFIKPLHEGSSKGISSPHSIIRTWDDLAVRVAQLYRWYAQPVLVETFLTGREFTVGILGNGLGARVLGIAEVNAVSPGKVSGYSDKEEWEHLSTDYYQVLARGPLYDQLAALALPAYLAVHCQDMGRVDIRLDATGQPYLLEINPLPALHPTHSAYTFIARHNGLPYAALIAAILEQAIRRWGLHN